MNQHCKFHLQYWMANCDPQVVLDEKQVIQYLVKYASKPGKRSTSINNIIQTMLPSYENDVEKSKGEESKS